MIIEVSVTSTKVCRDDQIQVLSVGRLENVQAWSGKDSYVPLDNALQTSETQSTSDRST
jgi:hypothetical protein